MNCNPLLLLLLLKRVSNYLPKDTSREGVETHVAIVPHTVSRGCSWDLPLNIPSAPKRPRVHLSRSREPKYNFAHSINIIRDDISFILVYIAFSVARYSQVRWLQDCNVDLGKGDCAYSPRFMAFSQLRTLNGRNNELEIELPFSYGPWVDMRFQACLSSEVRRRSPKFVLFCICYSR
jgi:hypothetical protein